jgi:hypothetical protein
MQSFASKVIISSLSVPEKLMEKERRGTRTGTKDVVVRDLIESFYSTG